MKVKIVTGFLLVFLAGCSYSSTNFIGAKGNVAAPIGNLQAVKVEDGVIKGYRCMGASLFRKHPINCREDLQVLFTSVSINPDN